MRDWHRRPINCTAEPLPACSSGVVPNAAKLQAGKPPKQHQADDMVTQLLEKAKAWSIPVGLVCCCVMLLPYSTVLCCCHFC